MSLFFLKLFKCKDFYRPVKVSLCLIDIALISLALLLVCNALVPLAGDETYQDIFQDFTHMASNDPDKLNRYQQYDAQRP